MNNEHCVKVCNRLLRGELSAVETYNQVIAKFGNFANSAKLEEIRSEHHSSAAVLADHIRSMGATPSSDAGAWGDFAKAVEGVATLIGPSSALRVLEEGEKHGIRDYKDALVDEGVMEEIKAAIRGNLLPKLEEHVIALEAFASVKS